MGFESVIYTCGVDEFGRDIVFFDMDTFGNKKWKCAQVKAVDIHGTLSKKGNIQEIINQIQEALDNPYFHPASGEEILINEAYIITSGEITPKAKTAIKNKFKQKPVFFIDRQELINNIEKYVPDILEKSDKTKAIKDRIQELLTSEKDADIREVESWFSEKELLELDEKLMDFISSQIFKHFFSFERLYGETNWEILSWLEDLETSENVFAKEIKDFLENFPYYDEFTAPHLIFLSLKSLKKLKEISPKTYSGLEVDVHLFFRNVKKSLEVLGYPYTRGILVHLIEESDALSDFYDGKKIDLQEKYILPTLIGMRRYRAAKLFLEKTKNNEEFFTQSFIFCVNAGVDSFRKSESNIVIKFSEFLKKSKLGPKLLPNLPSNYRILVSTQVFVVLPRSRPSLL